MPRDTLCVQQSQDLHVASLEVQPDCVRGHTAVQALAQVAHRMAAASLNPQLLVCFRRVPATMTGFLSRRPVRYSANATSLQSQANMCCRLEGRHAVLPSVNDIGS
jgi:hypothetical protein